MRVMNMNEYKEGGTSCGPGVNAATMQKGEAEEFVNFLFREGFFHKKTDFEVFDLHSITPSLSYLIHKNSDNPGNYCNTVISDYSSLALRKYNQQSSSKIEPGSSGIQELSNKSSGNVGSSQSALKLHVNPSNNHEKKQTSVKCRGDGAAWRANDIGIGLLLYGETTCFVLARMLEMAHTGILKERSEDGAEILEKEILNGLCQDTYFKGVPGLISRFSRGTESTSNGGVSCWILGPRMERVGSLGDEKKTTLCTNNVSNNSNIGSSGDSTKVFENGGERAGLSGNYYMTMDKRVNSRESLTNRNVFILNPHLEVDEIRNILRYDINNSLLVHQIFSCRADIIDLGLINFELVTNSPCFLLHVRCSIDLTLPVYIYRRKFKALVSVPGKIGKFENENEKENSDCSNSQKELLPDSILKGRYLIVGEDFQKSLEALMNLYSWLKEHSLNPKSPHFDLDFGKFYYNRTLELLSNIEYIVKLSNGIEKSIAFSSNSQYGISLVNKVDPRLGVGLTRSLGLSKFATPNSRCSISTTASNNTPVSVDDPQPESMLGIKHQQLRGLSSMTNSADFSNVAGLELSGTINNKLTGKYIDSGVSNVNVRVVAGNAESSAGVGGYLADNKNSDNRIIMGDNNLMLSKTTVLGGEQSNSFISSCSGSLRQEKTGRRGVRFASNVCDDNGIGNYEINGNNNSQKPQIINPNSHYSQINKPNNSSAVGSVSMNNCGDGTPQSLVSSIATNSGKPSGLIKQGTTGTVSSTVVTPASITSPAAAATNAAAAPVVSTLVPGAIVRFRSQIPVDAKLVQGVPETDYFTHVQQVYYHFQKGEWRAVYGPSKNRQQKSFSVNKYGFYEAKRLAEEWRLRYLYSNPNNNVTSVQTGANAIGYGLSSNGVNNTNNNSSVYAKNKTRKRKSSLPDKTVGLNQTKSRNTRSVPISPNSTISDLQEPSSVSKITDMNASYSSIDGMIAFGHAEFSTVSLEQGLIVGRKNSSSASAVTVDGTGNTICNIGGGRSGSNRSEAHNGDNRHSGDNQIVSIGCIGANNDSKSKSQSELASNKHVLHPSTIGNNHFMGSDIISNASVRDNHNIGVPMVMNNKSSICIDNSKNVIMEETNNCNGRNESNKCDSGTFNNKDMIGNAINTIGNLEDDCLRLENIIFDQQVAKSYNNDLLGIDSYLRVGMMGVNNGVGIVSPDGLQKITEINISSGNSMRMNNSDIVSSASLASTSNSTPIVVSEVSSPSISSPISMNEMSSSSRIVSPDKSLVSMKTGGVMIHGGNGVSGIHNVNFGQNSGCHPRISSDINISNSREAHTSDNNVNAPNIKTTNQSKINISRSVISQPCKNNTIMISNGNNGNNVPLSLISCENINDSKVVGGLVMINTLNNSEENRINSNSGISHNGGNNGDNTGVVCREDSSDRAGIYSVNLIEKGIIGCRRECMDSQNEVELNQEQRILDKERTRTTGNGGDGSIINGDPIEGNTNNSSGRNGDSGNHSGNGSNNNNNNNNDNSNNDNNDSNNSNPWVKRNGWEEDLIVDSFFVG
ncbi:hypothetical protein FG379_001600 [Cryptosporidium bovis]|uniref:uncharacterized protein n=1 Tax=Cryptosporidium bovis TaxID=310047 RepID=UPI00351A62E9|nr:hypothetical protein FG379_001600 [Cryptosporidium bovis]